MVRLGRGLRLSRASACITQVIRCPLVVLAFIMVRPTRTGAHLLTLSVYLESVISVVLWVRVAGTVE